MGRELQLTMTQQSIHPLRMIIHHLDRGLFLYLIPKLKEVMTYLLLTLKGQWITNHM